MPLTPTITIDEREHLRPLLSLIRDPERLCVCTLSGEFFGCADHARMAFQIWRRMGRSSDGTGAAWRRLMQSDCPTDEVMALVAFHIFHKFGNE